MCRLFESGQGHFIYVTDSERVLGIFTAGLPERLTALWDTGLQRQSSECGPTPLNRSRYNGKNLGVGLAPIRLMVVINPQEGEP
jgi:hypothetical protein